MVILRSHSRWNAWFFDVAWDHTFVILDKKHQRLSLLLITDTD
jgi:hypothetical protein